MLPSRCTRELTCFQSHVARRIISFSSWLTYVCMRASTKKRYTSAEKHLLQPQKSSRAEPVLLPSVLAYSSYPTLAASHLPLLLKLPPPPQEHLVCARFKTLITTALLGATRGQHPWPKSSKRHCGAPEHHLRTERSTVDCRLSRSQTPSATDFYFRARHLSVPLQIESWDPAECGEAVGKCCAAAASAYASKGQTKLNDILLLSC